MEFLRGTVTTSAANTFTETEIPTPVSRSEKLAMLIWKVHWRPDLQGTVDAAVVDFRAQLAKDTQNAFLLGDDDDLVGRFVRQRGAGAVQGSLSEYLVEVQDDLQEFFQPPMLYAKSSMFLGLDGVADTAVRTCAVVVGYTLERVPDALFIAALVD